MSVCSVCGGLGEFELITGNETESFCLLDAVIHFPDNWWLKERAATLVREAGPRPSERETDALEEPTEER